MASTGDHHLSHELKLYVSVYKEVKKKKQDTLCNYI